jgi:PAS domain S-box-containing protein
MPLPQFLSFGVAACIALEELHKSNRIHTDIRPQNIHWNPDNSEVELAHDAEREKGPHFSDTQLPYLSPEQTGRLNRSVDFRTDLYSLGIVFYELLTGKLPFLSEDSMELIHSHIAKQPVSPGQHNTAIPEQVSAIVMRLLEKDVDDRYQSVHGLRRDLGSCAEQWARHGSIDRFELGKLDFEGVFRISKKLFGREAEIDDLLKSLDSISQGLPEFHLVAGYSGVGKTALVHEIQDPVEAKGGYFIEGKFDQYLRNIPYSAFGQAFTELVKQLLMKSEFQLENWKMQFRESIGKNGKLITDVVPHLEMVVGPQPDIPVLDGEENRNRFNSVFQNFINLFTHKDRPLVLFLDDLQWIDTASLDFLKSLLSNPDAVSLLIIGAYRDNEVDANHPLAIGLAEMRETNASLQKMTLKPLSKADVNALCSETLNCSKSRSQPLAQLINRKTGGNALFTHQMLRSLSQENSLAFDASENEWRWDLDEIENKSIADNVTDLMIAKIKKFSESTQELLQFAACIGSQFDLSTLTTIAQRPAEVIQKFLEYCVGEQILLPVGEDFRFTHDRIQQAANALTDPAVLAQMHYQIGLSLLKGASEDAVDDRLYDIANHLNKALDVLEENEDLLLAVRMNLRAGQKAKSSAAYPDAKNYIEVAIELMGPLGWQTHYGLTLQLHNEYGELAFLTGEFDQVSASGEIIHANARNILDRVPIDTVIIEAETAQSNLPGAMETGLNILSDLGIEIPRQPEEEDYQQLRNRLSELLANKSVESWAELPEMENKSAIGASNILASEMSTSYVGHPQIHPMIAFHGAILTLEHGLNAWSPFFFSNVALATVTWIDLETPAKLAFEQIEFTKEMLSITRDTMENPVTARSRTKAMMLLAYVTPWVGPIEEAIAMARNTIQSGYSSGDLLYSSYGAYNYALQSFAAGKDLKAYQAHIADYEDHLRKTGLTLAADWLSIYQQTAHNFMVVSSEPDRLRGEYFDEDEWLPPALSANDMLGLDSHFINKLILSYHFDVDEKLVEIIGQSESLEADRPTTYKLLQFYLYFLLGRLRLVERGSRNDNRETINQVKKYLRWMKIWSNSAPSTFQHKYDLIAAELARVTGDLGGALSHYEQAIDGAREARAIHEEALAHELFGRFWIERTNTRFAGPLLDEAYSLYQRWGAAAKAGHLASRYSEWMTQEHDPGLAETATTNVPTSVNLDLTTILKASQKIASEITLKKLLTNLMEITIKNAGARKGFLLMKEKGRWVVLAGGDYESNVTLFEEPLNVEAMEDISSGIVNYVVNTRQNVVLDDAANEGSFTDDHVIKNRQSASVLCSPLIDQGQIKGVLYLVNNLLTGAFTLERVELLNLLSSQMAMALDNAKLLQNLSESELKYRQLVDNSLVGVFVSTLDGRFLFCNQALAEMYEFDSAEQLIAEGSVARWRHPNQRGHLMSELSAQKGVGNYEADTVTRTGRTIHVMISVRMSDDALSGMVMDITDKKNREIEVQRYQKRLRALSYEMIFAEESERQRIATELHDGPAQSLALARLQLAEAAEAAES